MSSLHSPLAADVLFHQMMVSLVERHGGMPRLHGCAVHAPALTKVRDYLHEHVGRAVTVRELAFLASMSRFQLTRQFQLAFGLPLHAYHLHVRLEESKRRLKLGAPVSVVATDLGFADQSHLHRRFKGMFGVTPGQWQSAHSDPRR